ncbi:MAG: hypothetical protein D6834_03610, partial [Aquificota bacterium]
NIIIDLYISTALDLKKKNLNPFASKVSKILPKLKKYIQENIEVLEETAYTLFDENHLGVTLYNKTVLEDFEIPPELKDINEELVKELFIFGLSAIQESIDDYLLEYPSDELIKLAHFVLSSAIEGDMNEDINVALETLKAIFYYPYIVKEYNYKLLNSSLKILEETKEIYEEIKLRHLYLTEKYDEFVKEFENFENDDEFLDLLYPMAKYFAGKQSKEETIKEFEKHKDENKGWEEVLDTVIAILKGDRKSLNALLDKLYADDILDAIYIYPYEPKLYEALELKYDYKPKEKRF